MASQPELERLITPAGQARVRAELNELWSVERPRVTAEVEAAAALGDRSENAEYIYGKKRLREIDRRLQYLAKKIERLQIVKPRPSPDGRVTFGAIVQVEDEDGAMHTWQIVGGDETDVSPMCISVVGPVGRALLGKRVDDEVDVDRPRGRTTFTIIDVRWPAEED